ncbi:hypothetical protein Tco_0701136 [Tanacetum coccineum]
MPSLSAFSIFSSGEILPPSSVRKKPPQPANTHPCQEKVSRRINEFSRLKSKNCFSLTTEFNPIPTHQCWPTTRRATGVLYTPPLTPIDSHTNPPSRLIHHSTSLSLSMKPTTTSTTTTTITLPTTPPLHQKDHYLHRVHHT